MGKHKHSKDKLYLNPTEYAESFGGYRQQVLPFKRLPLKCCSLSLRPFVGEPVLVPSKVDDILGLQSGLQQSSSSSSGGGSIFEQQHPVGHIFDSRFIIPYVKRTGKNPCTGKQLKIGDLVAIKFCEGQDKEEEIAAIGEDGETDTANGVNDKNLKKKKKKDFSASLLIDPIQQDKELTEQAHVVCNLKSGRIYLMETILRMNKQAKSFNDLISGEQFKWPDDICIIQDPNRPEIRQLDLFWYLSVACRGVEIPEIGLLADGTRDEGKIGGEITSELATTTSIGSDGTTVTAITNVTNSSSSSTTTVESSIRFDDNRESNPDGSDAHGGLKEILEGSRKRVLEVRAEQEAKRKKIEEVERERVERIEKAKQQEAERMGLGGLNSSVNGLTSRHKLYTTGAASRGFTSTAVGYQGSSSSAGFNEYRLNTDAEEREELYQMMNLKRLKKEEPELYKKFSSNGKGYVKLEIEVETGDGDSDDDGDKDDNDGKGSSSFQPLVSLNLELHCDITPHACDSFLRHCYSGYYIGSVFHRLVPNFILQGGSKHPKTIKNGTINTSGSVNIGHSYDNSGFFNTTTSQTPNSSETAKSFKAEFDSRLTYSSNDVNNGDGGVIAMSIDNNASTGSQSQASSLNASQVIGGNYKQCKSQFFISLRGGEEMDIELKNRFPIFGRIVGGYNNLRSSITELLENSNTKSKQQDSNISKVKTLRISKTEVFSDPFREFIKVKAEYDRVNKQRMNGGGTVTRGGINTWLPSRDASDPMRDHAKRRIDPASKSSIGKYMNLSRLPSASTTGTAATASDIPVTEREAVLASTLASQKKKQGGGISKGFKFDGW